jgi:hypothetical protein
MLGLLLLVFLILKLLMKFVHLLLVVTLDQGQVLLLVL